MTSGASVAALIALQPALEAVTGGPVTLRSRSVGVGATWIPNRLRNGEAADVVIVADDLLRQCEAEGLVVAGSRIPIAHSRVGVAVRAGAVAPRVNTIEDLRRTLLAASSIAYSASVSGRYLVTELWPRLGILQALMQKARCIGDERIGAVVARGDAEIGFEQMSELLPIPGIDHVTPLPDVAQRVTLFSGALAAASRQPERAQALLRLLAGAQAHAALMASGLQPLQPAG
jgi:molybdate transport system substrate-binding protein